MKSIPQHLTAAEEACLWNEAVFVFDSSTLLNFYEFSNGARKDIYDNIFALLRQRLWITRQTEYEFLKHRNKVLERPKALYEEIKTQHYPGKPFATFLQKYSQLKDRTNKDSRHPHLPPTIFAEFDIALATFQKLIKPLEDKISKQIEEQLTLHFEDIERDNLLGFFQVTPDYTYKEFMEIMKEGEFRYRHKIPPGYEDEKEKEEFGIDKFGDLFIWKQAIDLARTLHKPIILVIDDLKSDWCITEKGDTRKLISPRMELIKEMRDEGGVSFWAYNSSLFIHKAKEILKSSINENVIKEASNVAKSRRSPVEQAVFEWAKARFNSDETLWSDEFWRKDTGTDIIQTLDGVPFSIKVKYYPSGERIRMSDLSIDIEEIRLMDEGDLQFEGTTVVIVSDYPKVASAIKELISSKLNGLDFVAGYIGERGEFIEI